MTQNELVFFLQLFFVTQNSGVGEVLLGAFPRSMLNMTGFEGVTQTRAAACMAHLVARVQKIKVLKKFTISELFILGAICAILGV